MTHGYINDGTVAVMGKMYGQDGHDSWKTNSGIYLYFKVKHIYVHLKTLVLE